ncbi:choriogenin Hminor [Colletotrichum graminicola]|uniref:Choriogenin Hminor n=1 Tax=Colletotrichum graminicola (strain M1.001 / M2 / FGSC 10212) TaxID=645133 RepID=E3QET9_COLGM|nr:choriogenin Hminor [Colletotrichum graminicola M1.001]EFQ29395.1 choriogenin Hminor [Colletotrichum graminicola M1.001]WDK13875.1 choriogenin Hminor [Colletotrichum graminicola]
MTSSKLSVSRASVKSSFGHFSFSSQTNLVDSVSAKPRSQKHHHSVSEPLHEQQQQHDQRQDQEQQHHPQSALADPGRLDVSSSHTHSRPPPPPASPKRSQTDTEVKSPATAARLNSQSLTLTTEEKENDKEKPTEPVLAPSRPLNNRKSRSWGNRLSSLFPSLIIQSTDQLPPQPLAAQPQQQLPIHRKPLPASPPSDSPPSYDTTDKSTVRPVTSSVLGLGIAAPTLDSLDPPPPPPPSDAPPPVPGKIAHAPTYPPTISSSFAIQHPLLSPPQPPTPTTPSMMAAPMPPSEAPPPVSAKLRKDKSLPLPQTNHASPRVASQPETASPTKLRKEGVEHRKRSTSFLENRVSSFPMLGVRAPSPGPDARGRSTSANPPGARTNTGGSQTAPRNPRSNESQSPTHDDRRGRLRRSWLPGGGGSRPNSQDVTAATKNFQAWVLSPDTPGEYNTSFLLNAEKVPELWNENGNVCVYLQPRSSNSGPSFRVPSFSIINSVIFNELIQAEMASTGRSRARSFGGRDSLSVDDARAGGSPPLEGQESPGDLKLYLPATPPQYTEPENGQLAAPGSRLHADIDRLISIRNLFAFLTGQPLVATRTHPTTFAAFLQIAKLLKEYGFTNADGSSFGEAVDLSFGFYMEQLSLADVRHSREKTLESLILGEAMRSMELYNEAFAHAVGKYTAILDLRSPLFEQISHYTRQRLERAHLDLVNRQHNVNSRLEQFEFPSLFAGIASSTSNPELKAIRFKVWQRSFNKMKQFVLGYYKANFGAWPPKASSKKNPFSESGLNRLVLKALYSDMCSLYDLTVDRENITTRVMDGNAHEESGKTTDSPMIANLRKMLTEFDNSTPPVLPPIPFDVPKLPTMATILATYDSMSPKEQAKFDRKIKEHEMTLVIQKAYNWDTNSVNVPFLLEFKAFELHEAKGKNAADLADQRIGYWLFLYVVIQSLPMLVIDAPNLKFNEAVEYFLCEPPMGNLPWLEDARQVRKMWYEVSGGNGYVELSADSVLFSVEAVYHRSHCWLAAKEWEGMNGAAAPPPQDFGMSPLEPPRPVFPGPDGIAAGPASGTPPAPGSPQSHLRPRNASPGGRHLGSRNAQRSSMIFGLEPVPLDEGLPGDRTSRVPSARSSSAGSRPVSMVMPRTPSHTNMRHLSVDHTHTQEAAATSTMTFDDILGGGGEEKKPTKKKKGKFF